MNKYQKKEGRVVYLNRVPYRESTIRKMSIEEVHLLIADIMGEESKICSIREDFSNSMTIDHNSSDKEVKDYYDKLNRYSKAIRSLQYARTWIKAILRSKQTEDLEERTRTKLFIQFARERLSEETLKEIEDSVEENLLNLAKHE